mmetsp:Transcript_29227/g.51115  ORF Transcript_29227/g.51115 Transcript_29227/m.51115 type:complete len:458 (+) Transcript_29227:103-1476(+)
MGQKVSVHRCFYASEDAVEGTELINVVKGNAPFAKRAAQAACDKCNRPHTVDDRSPFLLYGSKAIEHASQRALDRLRRFRCRLSGRADPAALPKTPNHREVALRRREAYLLRLGIPRHSQARNLGCRGRRLRSCRPVTNSFKAACIDADRKASEDLELSLIALETPRSRGDSTCSESSSSRARGDSAYSETSSQDGSAMACGSEACEEITPTLEILPCQTPPRPDSQARMKFLQKLSYEGVWVPKPQRPPRHQTVIIFDWDDTLLCTSFLNDLQLIQLPEPVLRCLKEIEKVVINLLSLALSLGHTFIITNAVKGWVEHSAAKHIPGIMPVLQRVRVVSARSRYEAYYPGEVAKWKAETFLEVQRQLDSQVVTNVVSLGDSHFEMDAALVMGRQFEQAMIKTVKFQEAPSPEELVKQQELVCQEFERIVGNARNLRVRVQAPANRSSHRRNDKVPTP